MKKLAFQHIQRNLCKCDIVEEAFSKHTSQFVIQFARDRPSSDLAADIRSSELELKQLVRALLSVDPGPALHTLKAKIYLHVAMSVSDRCSANDSIRS